MKNFFACILVIVLLGMAGGCNRAKRSALIEKWASEEKSEEEWTVVDVELDDSLRPVMHGMPALKGMPMKRIDLAICRQISDIYGYNILNPGAERWGVPSFERAESIQIAPIDTVRILLSRWTTVIRYHAWNRNDTISNNEYTRYGFTHNGLRHRSSTPPENWEVFKMMSDNTIESLLPARYWTPRFEDYSTTCFGVRLFFKDNVIDSADIIRFYDGALDEYQPYPVKKKAYSKK